MRVLDELPPGVAFADVVALLEVADRQFACGVGIVARLGAFSFGRRLFDTERLQSERAVVVGRRPFGEVIADPEEEDRRSQDQPIAVFQRRLVVAPQLAVVDVAALAAQILQAPSVIEFDQHHVFA